MSKIRFLKPPPKEARFTLALPGIAALFLSGLFVICPFQVALYLTILTGWVCLRNPAAVAFIAHWQARLVERYPWIKKILSVRAIGIGMGMILFLTITLTSNPAFAQMFKQAEQQVTSIFGTYLENDIITFLFGLIRVVVWISGVGFVFFAIYQAQRGEQWQPLAQNAFIIVAAVVLVEGLSTLFFGGGSGTTTNNAPADG
jgi:uncharacterized membrane protein HdeD (DUF308 family)